MANILLIELQIGKEKLLWRHWISFLIIHAFIGFFIFLLFLDEKVARDLFIVVSDVSRFLLLTHEILRIEECEGIAPLYPMVLNWSGCLLILRLFYVFDAKHHWKLSEVIALLGFVVLSGVMRINRGLENVNFLVVTGLLLLFWYRKRRWPSWAVVQVMLHVLAAQDVLARILIIFGIILDNDILTLH